VTADHIARLRKLIAAATPLPWRFWTSNSHRRLKSDATPGHVAYGREQSDGTDDIVISEADMALIEAACNELPLMLDAMAEHERRMESVRVRAATHPDRYDEQRAFANGMREALRIMRDGA
jgi:hypothetical protein